MKIPTIVPQISITHRTKNYLLFTNFIPKDKNHKYYKSLNLFVFTFHSKYSNILMHNKSSINKNFFVFFFLKFVYTQFFPDHTFNINYAYTNQKHQKNNCSQVCLRCLQHKHSDNNCHRYKCFHQLTS